MTNFSISSFLSFSNSSFFVIQMTNLQARAVYQSFFDTSWISVYAEENERLFVAGIRSLRLASVRIIESAKNFKTLCKGLFILDKMLSGESIYDHIKISRSDISFLDMVMNSKLKTGL
eukprot:480113_1